MHPLILVKLTATIIALSSTLTLWLPSPLMARGNDIRGERLYQTYCYVCHGPEGKANGVGARHLVVKPRNLSDDAYMSSRTDQQLFDAIKAFGETRQMLLFYTRAIILHGYDNLTGLVSALCCLITAGATARPRSLAIVLACGQVVRFQERGSIATIKMAITPHRMVADMRRGLRPDS